MDDLPRPIGAMEADRVAQPKADRLAGSLRSRHACIAVRVGDVAADAQRVAARLEVDRSFPGIEPRLLLFDIDAAMRQRRRETADDRIVCVGGGYCCSILVVMRLAQRSEQGQNLVLVTRSLFAQSRGCHGVFSFGWGERNSSSR